MEAPDSRVALFKSSNGDLWASVMDTGFLKISRSTDDGATWSPAPPILNETIVEGQTQLTEFTDGGTFSGVAAAEDGDGGLEDGRYSQYMFYRLDLANAGAFATGVQATAQLNIVIQPAAGETITIGGRTYTFRTAPIADVAGNIAIGATDDITKANLVNAINGGGAAGPNTYARPPSPTTTPGSADSAPAQPPRSGLWKMVPRATPSMSQKPWPGPATSSPALLPR